MNHQEVFKQEQFVTNHQLGASLLQTFHAKRREFCDVNLPRFYSGWPYFILIMAALLMGSSKVSSQALASKEFLKKGESHDYN